MDIIIRQESPEDYSKVFKVIEAAFKKDPFSEGDEPYLVERLRQSEAFIPQLSLVAQLGPTVVGHILLSKIYITDTIHKHQALALAPVSVLPKYQQQGIGGALITKAHQIAKTLNYNCIVILGHQNYYPRFGYQQAHQFGISLPFDVPKENCMVLELQENALNDIKGIVVYPKAFTP